MGWVLAAPAFVRAVAMPLSSVGSAGLVARLAVLEGGWHAAAWAKIGVSVDLLAAVRARWHGGFSDLLNMV
jgi:hypothetical protein